MANRPAPNQRFAWGIFCDDIRFELGNKVTLVGLYNGDMYLPDWPAFIPKLAISAAFVSPLTEPITSLKLRVSKSDEIILEIGDTGRLPDFASPLTVLEEHDEPTRSNVIMHVSLPPMTVAGPCTLRLVLSVDGVDYDACKLRIGSPPTEPPQPPETTF